MKQILKDFLGLYSASTGKPLTVERQTKLVSRALVDLNERTNGAFEATLCQMNTDISRMNNN